MYFVISKKEITDDLSAVNYNTREISSTFVDIEMINQCSKDGYNGGGKGGEISNVHAITGTFEIEEKSSDPIEDQYVEGTKKITRINLSENFKGYIIVKHRDSWEGETTCDILYRGLYCTRYNTYKYDQVYPFDAGVILAETNHELVNVKEKISTFTPAFEHNEMLIIEKVNELLASSIIIHKRKEMNDVDTETGHTSSYHSIDLWKIKKGKKNIGGLTWSSDSNENSTKWTDTISFSIPMFELDISVIERGEKSWEEYGWSGKNKFVTSVGYSDEKKYELLYFIYTMIKKKEKEGK